MIALCPYFRTVEVIEYVLAIAKFGEVGSTHPWESSISFDPPPKIARENVLNRR